MFAQCSPHVLPSFSSCSPGFPPGTPASSSCPETCGCCKWVMCVCVSPVMTWWPGGPWPHPVSARIGSAPHNPIQGRSGRKWMDIFKELWVEECVVHRNSEALVGLSCLLTPPSGGSRLYHDFLWWSERSSAEVWLWGLMKCWGTPPHFLYVKPVHAI